MQVENKTSGKYSTKKNAKSCSLKLEAHLLKEVGSSHSDNSSCRSNSHRIYPSCNRVKYLVCSL